MNGPQDMGGFIGFGAINPETNEPVFHSEWERRAFALNLAMGMTGSWNIDISRHARERLDPIQYWSSSYYEYRHYALEMQLAKDGFATPDEIASGHMSAAPKPVKRVAKADMVAAILKAGGPVSRTSTAQPKFAVGDKVRALALTADTHTRLPRYAQGKTGEIVRLHGAHVFPDSNAHGKGEDPRHLYTVRFSGQELWGRSTPAFVNIDLWEPYLVRA